MSNKSFLNPWFDEAFSAPSGEAGPSSVDLYLNASPGSDMPAFGAPPRPSAFPDQGADPRAQTFMVPSPSVSTSASRPSFDSPRFGFNELFGNPDLSVNQNTAWSGIQEPPDDIRYRVGGFSHNDGMFGPPPVPEPAAVQPPVQSFLSPQAGANFGVQNIQPSTDFFKLPSLPVLQASQPRQTAPSLGDWSGGAGIMSPVPLSFAPSPAPMQASGMRSFASQVATFADPNLVAQTNPTLFGLPPYGNPSGPVGAPPAAPRSGFSPIPEYGRPVQPPRVAPAAPDAPPKTWRLVRQMLSTYPYSEISRWESERRAFGDAPDIFQPRPTTPAMTGQSSPVFRSANGSIGYQQDPAGPMSPFSQQAGSYAGTSASETPQAVRRAGGYQNRALVYSKGFGDLGGIGDTVAGGFHVAEHGSNKFNPSEKIGSIIGAIGDAFHPTQGMLGVGPGGGLGWTAGLFGELAPLEAGLSRGLGAMATWLRPREQISRVALPGPAVGTQAAWNGVINSGALPEGGMIAYRIYGGTSKSIGPWLSPIALDSQAARSLLALPPGNAASHMSVVRIPAGTQIQYGSAASAFGQTGGGSQIQLLQRISPSNFGPGIRILP